MKTQHTLIDELEALIDASDLASVVLALACVCNEKADHLRINWPDMKATAKDWDRAATKFDKLSVDSVVEQLS